jgi:hypothetical protein
VGTAAQRQQLPLPGRQEAVTLLQQRATEPEAAGLLSFIGALQAVVAGSRYPALADQPEFDYTMAAEILLLIESLGGAQG